MVVRVRHVESVIIVDLAGSLDRATAPRVRQALIEATAEIPAQVVVNLGEVHYLDASGLSALVLGLKRAFKNQGAFCLYGLQSPVRMIFELTRFDKIFEIYNLEEDAVKAAAIPNYTT